MSDDLPCADNALLVPLKRSAEYASIRRRVADPRAIDSWLEDGLHFFVFELKPVAAKKAHLAAEAPLAVFAMHPQAPIPISAVVVTPTGNGEQAEIRDLRDPDSPYTVPVPPA